MKTTAMGRVARATAVVAALTAMTAGSVAKAEYSLSQLQTINKYVEAKRWRALGRFLNKNPDLVTGDDPLAQELRSFVEGKKASGNSFSSPGAGIERETDREIARIRTTAQPGAPVVVRNVPPAPPTTTPGPASDPTPDTTPPDTTPPDTTPPDTTPPDTTPPDTTPPDTTPPDTTPPDTTPPDTTPPDTTPPDTTPPDTTPPDTTPP